MTAMIMGLRDGWSEKLVLLGTLMVYGVIIMLYAGVMRMIPPADIAPLGLTQSQMIWYIATTEFILFAAPSWGFKDIQNEINTEQVHLDIIRPFSPALLRIAFWYGEAIVRFCVLFPFYILTATYFAEAFEPSLLDLLGIIACAPLSLFMALVMYYAVGTSCLWVVQSEPAYWVVHKGIFLLGAMIWPIVFYPDWLGAISWFTPFPAILAVCGKWVLGSSALELGAAFAHQVVWAVLILYALMKFERIVLRRIQGEGAA
jgi:ABC-type uncharacterized transport system permease subunit